MKYILEKMRIKPLLVKIYFFIKNIVFIIFGIFYTKNKFSSMKTIFLIGTPEHDNLGDHLIALSELNFILDYFSDYNVVEISIEEFNLYKINLFMKVKNNDIFFLTGGGNIGDIYILDNKIRNFVIKHFVNNLIVIFPQTVFFSETKKGREQFLKTMNLYNSHPRLIISLREKISYELIKKHIPVNRILLCPDMVFRLCYDYNFPRCDIGICLRDDIESILTHDEKKQILLQIDNNNVKYLSTCANECVKHVDRISETDKIIKMFSHLKLIITDRLHGMIIAFITGTPCIVLNSSSHKILGSYDWIKNEPFIIYEKNIDNISDDIKKLDCLSVQTINKMDFSHYYKDLYRIISENI